MMKGKKQGRNKVTKKAKY